MNIKTFIKVFAFLLALMGGNKSLFAQRDAYYSPPDIHDTSVEGKRALAIYRMVFRNNPPIPKAGVNDWEKILTEDEEHRLDSLLSEIRNSAHLDIAIVTLDTICIKTEKFADISSRIADKWGVGKKENKNGVLISFSAGHKLAFIESGFGQERLLTEAQTKVVQNTFLLFLLSEGKYYEALKDAITAMAKMLSAP